MARKQHEANLSEIFPVIESCKASLQWLVKNLDRFIPYKEVEIEDGPVKAFAELSVATAYLHQWSTGPLEKILELSRYAKSLRSFVVRHAEDPRHSEMVLKRPPQALLFLIPYLMLRADGYRSSYYEKTILTLRRLGFPECVETHPHRVMDRHHLYWKAGITPTKPDWESLYKYTSLFNIKSSLHISDDTVYSITHTLFYMTDYGTNKLEIEKSDETRICEILEALLVHNWRLGNWDIVGELLINLHTIEARDTSLYKIASNAFFKAWNLDGSVPGKESYRQEQILDSHGLLLDEFDRCYHTTIVGILYCCTGILQGAFDKEALSDS